MIFFPQDLAQRIGKLQTSVASTGLHNEEQAVLDAGRQGRRKPMEF
jgi:hypothetical protein